MQRDLFPTEAAPPAATPGLFAEVVFDRPLDHAFTYAVGDALREQIGIGKRLRVPFGRGDKSIVGYCVGLSDKPPDRTVKEVLAVLDEEALLTDHLLRLTRWMADYYLCGWGQVLNAVVPAGAREQAGTRSRTFLEAVPEAELTSPPAGELPAKQLGVLTYLREADKPVEVKQLQRLTKCGAGPAQGAPRQGPDPPGDAPRRAAFAAAEDAVRRRAVHAQRRSGAGVASLLEAALREGGFQAFLLHGVTGSGKTEIYLRAIEEVVRQGKEAIVLVPEISLTPQTMQRFSGRCGDVAVLHSHLGNAERGGHWRRVAARARCRWSSARAAPSSPRRASSA